MDSVDLARKDEKAGLLGQTIELQTPIKAHRKRPRCLHFLHATILILLLLSWWSFQSILSLVQSRSRPSPNDHIATDNVDFADITPSEKLEWHPCFYNNFCARLTVPMDYNRPLNESGDNPKVHIALLIVPGKHPIWEKHSKSPLLINPGGPGGSGTMAAMGFGPYIQKVVGEDQDVIGFDPRGIGATTPRADCFSYPTPDDPDNEDQDRAYFHRMLWQVQGTEIGLVNSSSDSLAKLDTRARALAKLCGDKDALNGKDSILRHVSTPAVARDMISIIDAWDEWVEAESKTHWHETAEKAEKELEVSPQESEKAKILDTKGKLVYWGFSYGTLLGATFAAMFPDRVGRVVLDGVVDADHYVAPVWAESVQDTDAIMDSFSAYCHEAKDKCPMYQDGDKPEDIDSRLNGVLERIKKTPLTFSNRRSNVPVVIKYSDLKSLLFSTLYSPTAVWTPIASIFNELAAGHDEVLENLVYFPELAPFCGSLLPYWAYPSDAQNAIMCSDKRYPLNESLPILEARFEYIANMSSFADVWMSLMVGCDSWGIEAIDPPMRWDDHPAHKQKPINTSFPLLFVSNTLDPVTPLAAGVGMARKFIDAGLIEQQSEGHCSLSAVSKCTINKLREYFLLGKVPSHPSKLEKGEWVKCKADEWPFHPFNGDPFAAETEEERVETERIIAFKEMQTIARRMKFWGPKDLKLNWNLATEVQEQLARAGLPHFL